MISHLNSKRSKRDQNQISAEVMRVSIVRLMYITKDLRVSYGLIRVSF